MPSKPKSMEATNGVRPCEVEPRPLGQVGEVVLPLVYSCSGASSAAQMANHLAVRMDRMRVADMSCIAGLGGDVGPLLRTAKSGRPIVAIDGCPLRCVLRTLQRHQLSADRHYDLSDLGVRKCLHEDYSPTEAREVLEHIITDLGEATSKVMSRRTDQSRPTRQMNCPDMDLVGCGGT